MADLSGKIVLITAAAQGIGLASVHAFVAAGAKVIATDINEAKLRELDGTPNVTTRVLNVLKADEVGAWLDRYAPVAVPVGVAVSGKFGRGTGALTGLAVATADGPAAFLDPAALTGAYPDCPRDRLADPAPVKSTVSRSRASGDDPPPMYTDPLDPADTARYSRSHVADAPL